MERHPRESYTMLFLLNTLFGMYGIVWSQVTADTLTAITIKRESRKSQYAALEMCEVGGLCLPFVHQTPRNLVTGPPPHITGP